MRTLYTEAGYTFDVPVKIQEGMTLASHPFLPNTYIDINSTEDLIIRDKLSCISRIAQKVGVKYISGHALLVDDKKLEFDINGNINYKTIDVKGEFHIRKEDKYSSEYRIDRHFSGDYDKKSFEEAKHLLHLYGLEHDTEVKDLVMLRNPDECNLISRQTVHMEMTREVNSRKECAFSLNALEGILDIGIDTKNNISNISKVIFECTIEF